MIARFRWWLSLLLFRGGSYDHMPWLALWRWRLSRALAHGWAWVLARWDVGR